MTVIGTAGRIVAIGILLASGCTSATSSTNDGEFDDGQGEGAEMAIDFKDPMPDGIDVSVKGDDDIPFAIETPSSPSPTSIKSTPISEVGDEGHVEVVLTFDDPELGEFIVFEHAANGRAQVGYEEMASTEPGCVAVTPDPDAAEGDPNGPHLECHTGDRTLVRLRDGSVGALLKGGFTNFLWTTPIVSPDQEALSGYTDPTLELYLMAPLDAPMSPEWLANFAESFEAQVA